MSRPDNLAIFNTNNLVRSYNPDGGLTPAEHILVSNWIVPGSKVLDIGIGTGRTYPALSSIGSVYVGIDYSAAMVQAAKIRFPEGDFRVADASDMSGFTSGSFDAVVFSYNGIDYLHPYEQRLRAYSEMNRLLKPGGVLIFSSHNGRSVLRFNFSRTGSWRQTLKSIVVSAYTTLRSMRHLIFSKVFWSQAGYAYDRLLPLLTYYITPAKLQQEVSACSFVPLQVLGGDHPKPLWSFRSPWTYVAALKPEHKESDYEIDVAETDQQIEIAKKDWEALSSHEKIGVFQTHAWFQAWRSQLVASGRLKVIVARRKSNHEVVGFLPLVWQKRNAHRLISLPLNYVGIAGAGPGGADHLGPITGDKQVGAMLLKKAVEISRGSSLYLENLSSTWAAIAKVSIPAGKTTVLTVCPMNARGTGSSFENSWTKKMQKNLRRRFRLMSEEGIRFRWVTYGTDFEPALQALRDVHTQRWNARGGQGLFEDKREFFLLEYARLAKAPNQPIMLLMEENGKVIGGLLGLIQGKTFSVYKTGWHPEKAKLGIGIALGAEAMRWAEKKGFLIFDYLRGSRAHKKDLGCFPVTDESILISRGISGYLLTWRERLSSGGVWS